MKTSNLLKIGIVLLLIVGIGLFSFRSFAHKNKTSFNYEIENEIRTDDSIVNTENANVSVTIDSETTDDQIDDIVNLLKENGITPTLTNIERNDEGKITGIKIVLVDTNGNQTSSQTKSNFPISQIVFGRKNGLLYITQNTKDIGAFAFFNHHHL